MSRIHWPEALFASAAVLWAGALPLAPLGLASPTAGLPERAAAGLVYLAGAVVCHQRPERSFAWAGQAWPVCARCTGIYLGAAAAVLLFVAAGRAGARVSPAVRRGAGPASARLAVGVALVPAGVTLLWEWTTGVTPSNLVRATTGVVIGGTVAWVVMRALRAERALGVN
ncbi:MAG: DUF2085 domain-containing protein [Vicinamibacterales bacterium]